MERHPEATRLHPLLSIICAVIAGAESWDDIALFGQIKAAWFATFLDLPHSIPSHDTFNRVFAARGTLWVPVQFRRCFQSWMAAVATVLPTQTIALDGKTLRRSHDRFHGKGPLHLVSAWASGHRLILAQLPTDAKSNEITARPELLSQLAIAGAS